MARSDMSGPLIVEEGTFSRETEEVIEDSAISITSGVVRIGANVCTTAIALTIPDPTAGLQEDGGDDGKRLTVVDTVGAAHTLTPTTPFGNGGANEAKATFSAVIGDSISLIAYGGFWFITGKHQATVGAA